VVVQTTRRRRRTNVAATPDGALRETSQPCEGRPRDGDVPWNSRGAAETPGGASTDLSVPTTGKEGLSNREVRQAFGIPRSKAITSAREMKQ